MKLSSLARSYSSEVPKYLQNRPQDIIKHCLNHIALADSVTDDSVVQSDCGVFTIKSSHKKIKVNLAAPSCECFTWQTTHYPCKHMFAVSRIFSISLPADYLNNPWFVIDDDFLCKPSPLNLNVDDSPIHDELSPSSDCEFEAATNDDSFAELPSRCVTKGLLGEVQEQLGHLKNVAFQISSFDTLRSLNDSLKDLVKKYREGLAQGDGLILEKVCHLNQQLF